MDILQGNGAALRTGDRLLCDEYNVTILHKRSSVFFHNINNIILVGDDVRFDAQAAVLDAVNLDGFILFRIDDIPFGAFRLLRSIQCGVFLCVRLCGSCIGCGRRRCFVYGLYVVCFVRHVLQSLPL